MNPLRIVCGAPVALLLFPSFLFAGDGPQTEVIVDANQPEPIPLVYGVRVIGGAINPALDIDRFSFVGEVGDLVRVRISTDSTTLDPQYQVRDSTNALLDNWWCTSGASGCTFQREFYVTVAGLHSISLFDRNAASIGDYTIQFERVPPRTTERVIGYDRLVSDVIDYKLDQDAFRVEMVAGTTMSIAVSTPVLGLDPEYELFDPAGMKVDQWWCTSGATGCTFVRSLVPAQTGTYTMLVFDRELTHTGNYSLFVNCLSPTCPPTASETIRNGSGSNPIAYSVVCPAVLGGTLELEIDCSSRPAATSAFVLFYSAAARSPSPYGEILVDVTSTRLGRLVAPVSGGIATLSQPIPPDHALAGLFASSQGVIFGGGVQLTNAIDLVAGF